jgi:hypothetical protein
MLLSRPLPCAVEVRRAGKHELLDVRPGERVGHLGLDGIDAMAPTLVDPVAAIIDHVGVVAAPAPHLVGPVAAIKTVGPIAAVETVIAVITVEAIVALLAIDPVVAVLAPEPVIAPAASALQIRRRLRRVGRPGIRFGNILDVNRQALGVRSSCASVTVTTTSCDWVAS